MNREEMRKSLTDLSSPAPEQVTVAGKVHYVRVMTAFDADDMRKKLAKFKAEDGCETGRVLACILCDAKGELIFDIASAEDVLVLSKMHPKMSAEIFRVSRAVNEGEAGN